MPIQSDRILRWRCVIFFGIPTIAYQQMAVVNNEGLTVNQRLAILYEIFRVELNDPSLALTADTALATIPGWDSVNLSCVILGVEQKFVITFSPEQMDRLETVGDFLDIIDESTPA